MNIDKTLSKNFTLTQPHPYPPLSLHLPPPSLYPWPLLVEKYGPAAANVAIMLP